MWFKTAGNWDYYRSSSSGTQAYWYQHIISSDFGWRRGLKLCFLKEASKDCSLTSIALWCWVSLSCKRKAPFLPLCRLSLWVSFLLSASSICSCFLCNGVFLPSREWKLILPSPTALIMKLVGITTWKFPESSVRLPSEPQSCAVYMVMRSQAHLECFF